jgi:AcrR family transcriptional regulator
MEHISTKQQIMDVAERLFGEKGFDGTSMRELTTAAGVNLAAVNYHFRSKEGLLDAIFARRLEPMNRRRLELLEQALADAGDGLPCLERVLEALVGPPLRLRNDPSGGEAFFKLVGRIHSEPRPEAQAMFRKYFDEIEKRFLAALRRCLPDLPPVELLWRGIFSVGAMAHTLCQARELAPRHPDLNVEDVDSLVRRLVVFLAGGFRAGGCDAAERTQRPAARDSVAV